MNSELLKIRHKQSVKDFPHLNLEEDEYVELEFARATICTVLVWIGAAFAAVLTVVFMAIMNTRAGANLLPSISTSGVVTIIGLILFVLIALGALITTKVFRGNRLYLTNKRAIQYVMISLFGSSVNVIDLDKIEDVSFRQSGIFEYIFGIGTIRMSTVGDETTYTFKLAYKLSPKEMQTLTKLVSSSKSQPK